MHVSQIAKPIILGALLGCLVRLPGASVWAIDPYGFALNGLVPRDDRLLFQYDADGPTREIETALSAFAAKQPESGVNALARGLLLQPHHFALRRALGSQLILLGRSDEAVDHLKIAIHLEPEDAVSYFLLAQACSLSGQADEALAAAAEAVALRPGWSAAHLRYGFIQLENGMEKSGYKELQTALLCPVVPAETYFELGNYYLQHNAPDLSIGYLKEALKIRPEYSFAANNLGNAYKMMKEQDNARSWYLKAIAMDPANPNPRNALGVLYEEEHRPAEALEAFKAALRQDPNYFDAHYNAGVLLLGLKRNAEALPELTQASILRPRSALAHYQLALAQMRLGFLQQARASYKRAALLDPKLRLGDGAAALEPKGEPAPVDDAP